MERLKKQIQQRRDTFIKTNPCNYAKDQQEHSIEAYADTTTILVIQRYETGMVWCERWLEREGISVWNKTSQEKVPLDLNHYPLEASMIYGKFQPSETMPSEIEYDQKNPTLLKSANFYSHLKKIIHQISETGVVTKSKSGTFCIDFTK